MRKILILITVITLIISILSTGLIVMFAPQSPIDTQTLSGATR